MTEKFYFFWKHRLSQWHMCDFSINGIVYNCAEQYMMSMKSKLFNDNDTYEKIMNSCSPREHQNLGRKVMGFDKKIWDENARKIVTKGNYHLFTQNKDQKELLLSTGTDTLVEASPYDKIWGIGLAANDIRALKRETWQGTNWLGQCLTKVRNRLQEEEKLT